MVQIVCNQQIKSLIKQYNNDQSLKIGIKNECISHSQLCLILRKLNKIQELSTILKTTKMKFQSEIMKKKQQEEEIKNKKQKTKEYLEYMEKLKNQQLELEYQQMIGNIIPERVTIGWTIQDETHQTPSQIAKELKSQITTVINILITVVSVSYAVWYWTGSSFGWSLSTRTLLSLFFGILVLVAEVVVYHGYVTKIDDAKKLEKAKVEVKNIVGKVAY